MNRTIIAIIACAALMGCATLKTALPKAQEALEGVKVTVQGEADLSVGLSTRAFAVFPGASASMAVTLPLIGQIYSLDTNQHPGPWIFEVVLKTEADEDWISLEPRGVAYARDKFPGLVPEDPKEQLVSKALRGSLPPKLDFIKLKKRK